MMLKSVAPVGPSAVNHSDPRIHTHIPLHPAGASWSLWLRRTHVSWLNRLLHVELQRFPDLGSLQPGST